MKNMRTKDILKIILEIAQSIKYGLILNERYLHHYFSGLLQKKYDLLKLNEDEKTFVLHPEWPTHKKTTGLTEYGRYRKENKVYKPNVKGTAGFIDFAIGNYKKPDIGIEFSLRYTWSTEDIVFDFVKLLDKKNPFKVLISFNLILRDRRLVQGGYLRRLEERMNNAYREAVSRLNDDVYGNSKELYFIVIEVDKGNNRRHWHYDRASGEFKLGLPVLV